MCRLLVCLSIALCCLACSDSGGDLVDSLSSPPAVTRTGLSDRSLPFHGTGLVISAKVVSNRGLERVWATATSADGRSLEQELTASDEGDWVAQIDLYSNPGTDTVAWTVLVSARDGIGNQVSGEAQSVTVGVARQPPAPPEP